MSLQDHRGNVFSSHGTEGTVNMELTCKHFNETSKVRYAQAVLDGRPLSVRLNSESLDILDQLRQSTGRGPFAKIIRLEKELAHADERNNEYASKNDALEIAVKNLTETNGKLEARLKEALDIKKPTKPTFTHGFAVGDRVKYARGEEPFTGKVGTVVKETCVPGRQKVATSDKTIAIRFDGDVWADHYGCFSNIDHYIDPPKFAHGFKVGDRVKYRLKGTTDRFTEGEVVDCCDLSSHHRLNDEYVVIRKQGRKAECWSVRHHEIVAA